MTDKTKITSCESKTIYYFDDDPGYEKLQEITGGYLTTLPLTDGRTMFLNESGEHTCKINNEASNMFGIVIFGNIAIVGKKSE